MHKHSKTLLAKIILISGLLSFLPQTCVWANGVFLPEFSPAALPLAANLHQVTPPVSTKIASHITNNPIRYTDPTGHSWWSHFWKSLVGGVAAGVTFVAITAATGGTGVVLAAAVAGMVGGAVTGGLEGGLKGAITGAGIGLAMGTGVGLWGAPFAVGSLALGAGYSFATGGLDGLSDFSASVAGGAIGFGVGRAAAPAMINAAKTAGQMMGDLAQQAGKTIANNFGKMAPKLNVGLSVDFRPKVPTVELGWGGGKGLAGDVAQTFRDGKYRSIVLKNDVTAYRYSGGRASPAGRYLTTQQTVDQISSPADARQMLNLPEGSTAEQLNMFRIPKGTQINVGRVEGGGEHATQIYVEDPGVLQPVE